MTDTPENPRLRKAALRAMRQHIELLGGLTAFREAHGISERAAQRIQAGDKLPPSLCAEIATMIERDPIADQDSRRRGEALSAYADAELAR